MTVWPERRDHEGGRHRATARPSAPCHEVLVLAEHPNATDRRSPRAARSASSRAARRPHHDRGPATRGVSIGDDRARPARTAPTSSSRSTSDAAARPRSNGRRLWQASQATLEAEHRIVELLQTTIVPDRLPDAARRPGRGGVPPGRGRRRRRRRLVRRVRRRRRSRSSSSSATSPATASRPRASWDACATRCARTRSRTPIPRRSCCACISCCRAQDDDAMVTAFVARLRPGHRRDVVVARRPSAAAARRARRHDPLPRRRQRRAARHDGARTRDRARSRSTAGRAARLLHRRSGRAPRPATRRRPRLARASACASTPTTDSTTLCDKLVDDPFVPHPSPDDICVLALRVSSCRAREPRTSSPIDIGGTKLAAGIVAADGELLDPRTSRRRRRTTDADALFATLAALDRRARHDGAADAVRRRLRRTDDGGGEHVSPLNIPAWRGFPLRGPPRRALSGFPVSVDNDAKALALGEGWIGAARRRARLHRHGRVDGRRRRHRPRRPPARRRRRQRGPHRPRHRRARRPRVRVRRARLRRGRGVGHRDRAHHRPAAGATRRPRSARAPARSSGARSRRSRTCSTCRSRSSAARSRSASASRSSPPRRPRSTRAAASTSRTGTRVVPGALGADGPLDRRRRRRPRRSSVA